jgi:hypothetical protein
MALCVRPKAKENASFAGFQLTTAHRKTPSRRGGAKEARAKSMDAEFSDFSLLASL